MVWVKVDDHYDEHRKFAAVGPLGHALWLAGMAYCNRNETDGFIPWSKARSLLAWEFPGVPDEEGRRKRYRITISTGMVGDNVSDEFVIELLLEAGLWTEVDAGYQVHDYEKYQPTKADLEEQRARKQAAGQAGGQASAQARAQRSASAGGQADRQAKSNPGPGPGPGAASKEAAGAPAAPAPPKSRKPPREPLTTQQRADILDKYREKFGSDEATNEIIEVAMNHEGRYRAIRENLYVQNWLNRERPRIPGKSSTNGYTPERIGRAVVIDRD